MTQKTESEVLFEAFCVANRLDWSPHGTSDTRTPDYRLSFGGTTVCVEVKQIESEASFSSGGRQVGEHIRRKITESKGQLQTASRAGLPTVLLIYNAIDPHQDFGTEDHDFTFAMYGEWTVALEEGKIVDSFENAYARVPLPYAALPDCFEIVRVEVGNAVPAGAYRD